MGRNSSPHHYVWFHFLAGNPPLLLLLLLLLTSSLCVCISQLLYSTSFLSTCLHHIPLYQLLCITFSLSTCPYQKHLFQRVSLKLLFFYQLVSACLHHSSLCQLVISMNFSVSNSSLSMYGRHGSWDAETPWLFRVAGAGTC